jgi:hypothetical protein
MDLKFQIETFEAKLCLRILDSTSETLALTEDGRILTYSDPRSTTP